MWQMYSYRLLAHSECRPDYKDNNNRKSVFSVEIGTAKSLKPIESRYQFLKLD